MSSNEIAISIKHVHKSFWIYANPSDRLKQFIIPKIVSPFRAHPPTYGKEFKALTDISFDIKKVRPLA